MTEQWIDLDTASPEMLAMIQDHIVNVHGEMELIEETDAAWIVRCPACGDTRRVGKHDAALQFLSLGRLRRKGDDWLLCTHEWYSPGFPSRITDATIVQ